MAAPGCLARDYPACEMESASGCSGHGPWTLTMLMGEGSLQDLLWVSCYGCASEASISLNFSPIRRSEVVSMNYPMPEVSGSKWDINHLRVLYVEFSENLPFDRLFRDSWRSDGDSGESIHNYTYYLHIISIEGFYLTIMIIKYRIAKRDLLALSEDEPQAMKAQ